MSLAVFICIVICGLTIVIDVALLFCWFFSRIDYKSEGELSPEVSILIAARNEEANIAKCLDSMLKLDYPVGKLEILVGDDSSEDDTYSIANVYASRYDHIHVLQVKENLGQARGKANVLAQLAKKATGLYYFIADADVQVPSTWVRSMLKGLKDNVGIVNGFTKVENNIWQNIDWVFALGMVKVISDKGRPVTAMGNNMLVTRKAYEAVGGYESIPFSVTEDFELFKQVRKKGFNIMQLADESVTATTLAQKGFYTLLNQRKRWMMGAMQLPWPIVLLLFLQAIYYPGLLLLFWLAPTIGALLFAVKLISQFVFIKSVSSHLYIKLPWHKVLLYECYSLVLSISTTIFYLLPIRIIWKGRKY